MNNMGFQPRIESIRGIAALNVGITHSMMVLSVDGNGLFWSQGIQNMQSLQGILTRLIIGVCNGGLSVLIFFLISGYVLGLSLDREKRMTAGVWGKFAIKRIFRIFPAHIVALFFIAVYQLFFLKIMNYPNTTVWFSWWYKTEYSGMEMLKNSILYSVSMNHIAWSLKVEFIASLFIPALHLINRRFSPALDALMIFLLVVLAYYHQEYKPFAFLFIFYLGMMMPEYGKRLIGFLSRYLNGNLILLLSFIIMIFPSLIFQKNFSHFLWEAAGAFVLMSILQFGEGVRFSRILETRWVRSFGKISYSFYLYHFIVLYVCSTIFIPHVPEGLLREYPLLFSVGLCLISIGITLPISACSYRVIEFNFIDIGKRLIKSI